MESSIKRDSGPGIANSPRHLQTTCMKLWPCSSWYRVWTCHQCSWVLIVLFPGWWPRPSKKPAEKNFLLVHSSFLTSYCLVAGCFAKWAPMKPWISWKNLRGTMCCEELPTQCEEPSIVSLRSQEGWWLSWLSHDPKDMLSWNMIYFLLLLFYFTTCKSLIIIIIIIILAALFLLLKKRLGRGRCHGIHCPGRPGPLYSLRPRCGIQSLRLCQWGNWDPWSYPLSSKLAGKYLAIVRGWLVDWNMNFIFAYIGKNHPNWRSHVFQRGRYTTNQIDFPWSFPPKPPFSHGLQQRTSWGEGPPWITGLYLSTGPNLASGYWTQLWKITILNR